MIIETYHNSQECEEENFFQDWF